MMKRHPLQRPQATGQGFHEHRARIRYMIRDRHHCCIHQNRRDTYEFSKAARLNVGFFKHGIHGLAAACGVMRCHIGRMVCQGHALANGKARHTLTNRMHHTHHLMPQLLRFCIITKHLGRIRAANAAHDQPHDDFICGRQWLLHVEKGNNVL